jgi:hypothetical protein
MAAVGETAGVLDVPPYSADTTVADADGDGYVDTGLGLAELYANDPQTDEVAAASHGTKPETLVGGRGYEISAIGTTAVAGFNVAGMAPEVRSRATMPRRIGAVTMTVLNGHRRPPTRYL